jgi:hypothetical protein
LRWLEIRQANLQLICRPEAGFVVWLILPTLGLIAGGIFSATVGFKTNFLKYKGYEKLAH